MTLVTAQARLLATVGAAGRFETHWDLAGIEDINA